MAQKPFARFVVICGDIVSVAPFLDGVKNIRVKRRVQGTVFAFDYSVAVGGKKAEIESLFIAPNGELRFVAVTISFGGRGDAIATNVKSADTGELRVNEVLLYFKLLFVADMAENTAAAFGKYGAIHLYPCLGWGEYLFNLGISVG